MTEITLQVPHKTRYNRPVAAHPLLSFLDNPYTLRKLQIATAIMVWLIFYSSGVVLVYLVARSWRGQ